MANRPLFEKSGIVLVDKPAGVSSNKVVNIVKFKLGAKKAGHLGTLDLEGEGLLPVTVNNATKLFDFFLNKTKTYETVFVFGVETDTLDMSGQILREKECHLSLKQVEDVAKGMIGKYNQMPPQYSAKKVGGKVAYKEARKGKALELKPKEVEIFDFKLISQEGENKFRFQITCSSGTYIRSICRDMAEKLSTYGSMQCILRTNCGDFDLKDAYTFEEIKDGNFEVLSCENLFDFAKVLLLHEDVEKLFHGQRLSLFKENGLVRIFDKTQKTFVGIGEVVDNILKLVLRL